MIKSLAVMYCPNCGKPNSAEQRFCRSCGLQLEETVLSLKKQLSATELSHLEGRKRAVERSLTIIGSGAISLVGAAVVWGIIYKIIIAKGELLGGSIFLAVVLGFIIFGLLALYRDSLERASRRQLPGLTLPPADTAKLVAEPAVDSAPSITERTTEMLRTDEGRQGSS